MQSRTRTTSHVLLLIAAGALGATLNLPIPAPAQEIGVQLFAPPISAVPPSQLPLPHGGATLERYFARLRIEYAQLDADQDGKLTQRDVDTHALMEAAWLRVYALHSVMRFDLDGDGAVTEDEVRRAMRYELRGSPSDPEKKIDDTVRSIMALDTDKDGKVGVTEAGKSIPPELRRNLGLPEAPGRTSRALTLDSSAKGEVTLQAYEAAGEALFRKVDADHDGKISPQELDDYRRTLSSSPPPADQPR